MDDMATTPDLGGVLSAATAYGDARADEVRAELQPALDDARAAAIEAEARADAAEKALADHMATHEPDPEPEPEPEPEPQPSTKKIIGMSAPASLWSQRLAEVGPNGIKARRIFADLTSTGRDQETLVRAAINDGLLPVVSYKVPSPASAASGSYDAWARAAADFLDSFGKTVAVSVWHEPHGDMTPAEFIAMQKRLMPLLKRPNVKVGPLLNGWLLDRRLSDFASYTDAALLNTWDWFGIDTYGDDPGSRMPLLQSFLDSRGHGTKPTGIGEYNADTASAVTRAGEAFLSSKTLWFACVWNSTGGTYVPLSGDRLAAFKATKSDPRVQQ